MGIAYMLKAEIILASWVLLCGQVVLWRRRDNIFGYLQGGLFFASIFVPVLGTTIIDDTDPSTVGLYARILMIGAAAYMAGLLYGSLFGHSQRLPGVTFSMPFGGRVQSLIARRSRGVAAVAGGALAISFILLGYIPFFAADRVGAKYGVGIYREGFERGALVFHVALRMGSTILPVILALYLHRRRGLDLVLSGMLALGLALTLSRGSVLIGPVVFVIALLIFHRWKAWKILSVVCAFFVSATLVNELIEVAKPASSASFSARVAASAPDVADHLGFLNGFELSGGEEVGLRPIIAALSLNKGEFNPSSYALRIRTGLSDRSEFASGGIRLPASIWGYAAFGYLGVVSWSFVSGVFIGWGTVLVRRLLSVPSGKSGQVMNLVLAWVFFQGTFALMGNFYFPERVGVVSLGLALALCWKTTARTSDVPTSAPAEAPRAAASVSG